MDLDFLNDIVSKTESKTYSIDFDVEDISITATSNRLRLVLATISNQTKITKEDILVMSDLVDILRMLEELNE